jgi:hypothetical protein
MEMAVKTSERGSAGNSFPRRRQAWGAPPLSLPPSWLFGSPPPWRWDPWGRQKRGFWWLKFVGGGVLHELGFLPLYSFSDFRHPLLGFHQNGPIGRVRTPIGPNFNSRTFSIKLSKTSSSVPTPLEVIFEGQTDNLRKQFWDRFQQSSNSTPTRFPLVFLIIPTHQSVKQEHCALLQLLIG